MSGNVHGREYIPPSESTPIQAPGDKSIESIIEKGRLLGCIVDITVTPASEKVDGVAKRQLTRTTAQKTLSRYDNQFIINFGRGTTAEMLTKKAASKILNTTLINSNTTSVRPAPIASDQVQVLQPTIDSSQFDRLTPRSRIYLIGHANSGFNGIYSDTVEDPQTQQKFQSFKTAEELANDILLGAPHLKNSNSGDWRSTSESKPLKISLVACFGGLGFAETGGADSFAARLCKALHDRGIYAEISARTDAMDRAHPEKQSKSVQGRHHATGDKVTFRMQGDVLNVKIYDYKTHSERPIPKPLDLKKTESLLDPLRTERPLMPKGAVFIHYDGEENMLSYATPEGRIRNFLMPKDARELDVSLDKHKQEIERTQPFRFVYFELNMHDTNRLLKTQPQGSAALRYSDEQKLLLLNYKDAQGHLKTINLTHLSPQEQEEHLQKYNIIHPQFLY